MKKHLLILSVLVLSLCLSLIAFAALKGNKIELKVGDEVYACACGAGCDCDTISRNPGKCSCGGDLVKAKVTKVEAGKAYLKADGWPSERSIQDRREIHLFMPSGRLQLRYDQPETRQMRMRNGPEGVQKVTARSDTPSCGQG